MDVGPLFQTPEEAARQAIENDVHVVGVSSQAAGHKTLVPALVEALRAQDAGDVAVVCGGVIPSQDHEMLRRAGVAAIYGPGAHIPAVAAEVLEVVRMRVADYNGGCNNGTGATGTRGGAGEARTGRP